MQTHPEPHFEANHWPRCTQCAAPIRVGQFVLLIADDAEIHVDCARPYRLPSETTDARVMLGEPMMALRIGETLA